MVIKMTGKQKKALKRNAIGYSFILPNFIGYFIFIFVPVILTFVLCVMKWDGSSAPMEFVGLKNFMKLFRDSGFRISVSNTLFYAVFTVPLTMVAALLIAVRSSFPMSPPWWRWELSGTCCSSLSSARLMNSSSSSALPIRPSGARPRTGP